MTGLDGTELDEEIYLLVDNDGDVQNWTPRRSVANMKAIQDDLQVLRFSYDPLATEPWETVDTQQYNTFDQPEEI